MKNLIVANWKMNMSVVNAVIFVQKLRDLRQNDKSDVVICPPFTALSALRYELQKGKGTFSMNIYYPIHLGAQNIYHEEKGAFTGEVSAQIVKELASYVIIGHSERRRMFNETDDVVNKKIKSAQSAGLIPIVCFGVKNDFVEKDLQQQLEECLEGVESKFVLAYEPVDAIGTGKPANPKRINNILCFIRRFLEQKFGPKTAMNTRLLYGGSVKSNNARAFLQEKEINGLLIGGASLDVEEFYRIIIQAQ
ncbi:triose-phosphate isomerase [Candidatus Woesearchaeota archaeon CG10_big_fil_rev_8_21_14_0_10_34_8]|nr:MAG: triose-phosphate isomerase [Candidatus Woesearchaeota archaeon CG10_big_fil_rev_8_21_14_0_10_34_8]